MNNTRRMRLQGIAMLAVALAVGVLIGVTGERVRAAASTPDMPPFGRGGGREGRGPIPPPFERIGLTDSQRTQIITILESRRARTESIMQTLLPRLRSHTDSVRSELAAVLTPEQLERLDAEFEAMRSRRGGPGERGFRRGFGRPAPARPPRVP